MGLNLTVGFAVLCVLALVGIVCYLIDKSADGPSSPPSR